MSIARQPGGRLVVRQLVAGSDREVVEGGDVLAHLLPGCESEHRLQVEVVLSSSRNGTSCWNRWASGLKNEVVATRPALARLASTTPYN